MEIPGLAYFIKWWNDYKQQKKIDEMYARLDRNKAGKFNMKEYRKGVNAAKKKQRENVRKKQEDMK